MGQGFSLHIGLNGVDSTKYNGWPGTLSGCVNDANAMQAICGSRGFLTQLLLNGDATSDAILGAIGQAAYNLQSEDTFILTYSGHGGQVPDPTGDSPNGLDDTWVAYDRMVLGHELYNLWSQFKTDVRIEVYSDSCHSGTVIRDVMPQPRRFFVKTSKPEDAPQKATPTQMFNTVYGAALMAKTLPQTALSKSARLIPAELALQLYSQHQSMYEALQWSRKRADIPCSVILISGCQDNQTSADGQNNGLFTEKLLVVWNQGAFNGTLPQFYNAITALMPSTQTPNYFTVGIADQTFTNSLPFTIVQTDAAFLSDSNTQTSTAEEQPPGISGPDSISRDSGVPPSFQVTLGSNKYYIFEIGSDPLLFGDTTNRMRTTATWYASWADPGAPARYTDTSYTIPQKAWDNIKGNDKLYYRVGSTSSLTAWDNYQVSVTDGDAPTSAPSIRIISSKDLPGKDVPFAALIGTY